MVKRKGLFHIIEIVIISLVMFVMIFQITYIPRTTPEWDISKLTVQGRDMLYSMEDAGVDWSSEDDVSGFVGDAIDLEEVRYKLELIGAPQKDISVGCLCDGGVECGDFCDWLDDALPDPGGLSFNGMDTGFSVTDTVSVDCTFDVMVSSQSLAGMYDVIGRCLSEGRGFVLVRDLESQDFSQYGSILNTFFAVDEYGSGGSGEVSFDLSMLEAAPEYYRIARYFSHIPNGTGGFYNTTHVFEGFADDAVEGMPGGMTVLETSDRYPACIAVHGAANGSGRTAWISGGLTTLDGDDKDMMMTALAIWSSKHRRLVSSTGMNVERATASMYRVPEDTGRADYMFQPMEAVLTLGYWY